MPHLQGCLVEFMYIGEVLYCGDETSVKGPFRSDAAAKQNLNVYSLKVGTCKETLDNQITRDGIVHMQQ